MAELATRYTPRRRHITILLLSSTRKSHVVALHSICAHQRAPHQAALYLFAVPRDDFVVV